MVKSHFVAYTKFTQTYKLGGVRSAGVLADKLHSSPCTRTQMWFVWVRAGHPVTCDWVSVELSPRGV